MKQRTLLFIGAHPDDETFGLGTTLAHYAQVGVKVYYMCATRGESGTVDAQYMKGYTSVAELRTAEMTCAARVLGLNDVIYLGFRDSGMSGSPDNKSPDSLVMANLEEVAGRIVKVLRDLKPDVVVTHDAGGGYGHPDHIKVHQGTVKAFAASNDPTRYPEAGRAFQPAKLYFAIRPRGGMKFMVKIMPFFGQDPKRFGRNKDIDLTKMMVEEYPINAVVRLSRQAEKIRNQAFACHASQGGGGPRRGPFRLISFMDRIFGPRDYFMRSYPVPGKNREKDLFEGLE